MKVVKTLDDITLPEEGTVEIPRPKGDLRIPIRPISATEHERIIQEHLPPAPPQKFDKTGKMTMDGKPGFYFDESDPVHQGIVREKNVAMMRDFVLAGVALDLPGNNAEEKYAELARRLTLGDISIITDAVNALSNITGEKADEVKNSSNPES